MAKWSLRTKILISVGAIIFIALGTSTIVQTRGLQRDYFQSIEWRSEALAQSIVNDVADMFEYVAYNRSMLMSLGGPIRQLYEANSTKDVTHIAFIDNEGVYVVHSDSTLQDTPVAGDLLTDALARQQQATVLAGNVYHTIVPVFGTQDNMYLGAVSVGFPKSAFDEKQRATMLSAATLFVIFLVFAILAFSLLMNSVLTKPVQRLVSAGKALASGDLEQNFDSGGRQDEVAVVGAVFDQVAHYLKHVAQVAADISMGVLDGQVRVRSQKDALGQAVQEMLLYLNYIESIAQRIAGGDLHENVTVRSEHDAFGQSIQSMLEGLRTLIVRIRTSANQIDATQRSIAALSSHDMEIVRGVHAASESAMTTLHLMGGSVEEVAQNMDALSSSVAETSASVSQMAASITHISRHTNDLTRQTQETISYLDRAAASLEDVVGQTDVSQHLSQDTREDAQRGREAMEAVTGSMATIQQTMSTAVEAMTQFATRSQDIGRILDVIREITDQTGLLALNASIIAAQAGSHGRGFAVVADEIRNLATDVGSSTKDIATIVGDLQHDTARVMDTVHAGAEDVKQGMQRTEQARDMLDKIFHSAERSSDVVTDIARTLNGLRTASQEVAASMERVNTMTDDITSAVSQHEASTRQINTATGQVNEMASSIQEAMSQQLEGIRHVIQVMQDVANLIDSNLESSQKITVTTEELASQAAFLLESVDRFTVEG